MANPVIASSDKADEALEKAELHGYNSEAKVNPLHPRKRLILRQKADEPLDMCESETGYSSNVSGFAPSGKKIYISTLFCTKAEAEAEQRRIIKKTAITITDSGVKAEALHVFTLKD